MSWLLLLDNWALLTLAAVLGSLIGSFLNVVIFRTPVILERQWCEDCRELLELEPEPTKTAPEKLSLAWPGSHCPHCQSAIRPWHNIPILGFLMLRGRCADCSAPISIRYPLVELLTAALSLFVVSVYGPGWEALAALFFTWALIALAAIDFDTQLLPDEITYPLLWLGILCNSMNMFTSLTHAVWGCVIGYMSLWTVYQVHNKLTGKEGMGRGDFKLLAGLGAWMGWSALPMIILLSSVTGLLVAGFMMLFLSHDRQVPIAFGPYLAIAGWLSFFFGEQILVWLPILSAG